MYGRLVRFALPYIRFLFVRPGVCPAGFLILPSGFLQIPPHGGHPCLRLTVPTAKSVVDFHHQVIAHAGRTIKKPARKIPAGFTPNGARPSSMAVNTVINDYNIPKIKGQKSCRIIGYLPLTTSSLTSIEGAPTQ